MPALGSKAGAGTAVQHQAGHEAGRERRAEAARGPVLPRRGHQRAAGGAFVRSVRKTAERPTFSLGMSAARPRPAHRPCFQITCLFAGLVHPAFVERQFGLCQRCQPRSYTRRKPPGLHSFNTEVSLGRFGDPHSAQGPCSESK